MRFVSLGEGHNEASFGEALRQGMAPDGSLYFPNSIPRLSQGDLAGLYCADISQTADIILPHWLGDELGDEDIHKIVERAATFPTPVKDVGDKKVLELFHGPTMAFKDVAARYLAALMSHYNAQDGYESRVLVATSGDTGGAIAHGFADIPGVAVTILFPKGKVSELQREQLVRTADNVNAYEVDGTFDDCQKLVIRALGDVALDALHVSSANSISVGRLIPQTIYYANAWGQLGHGTQARFVVPTGNLGNLTAGILAQRMGVPITSFLAANNRNDALTRYLSRGKYQPLDTEPTMSNAMDVGAPNNMPRFIRLFRGDVDKARQKVQATSVDDEAVVDTIKTVYEKHGYLLDPHTAVAWAASERVASPRGVKDIIVSTASPVKFSREILRATGISVSNSDEMEALQALPEHVAPLPNSYDAFKAALLGL